MLSSRPRLFSCFYSEKKILGRTYVSHFPAHEVGMNHTDKFDEIQPPNNNSCRISVICQKQPLSFASSRCLWPLLYMYINVFFGPMPPQVLVDFVVLPPEHGRSVNDFWGWDAHEAQLRCPNYVSGDIGECGARRVLKPTQTMVTAGILPFRENSHGRAGNRTRNLMISSQRPWPLDHEAGLYINVSHENFRFMLAIYIDAQFSMARSKGNYNESKVHDKHHVHGDKWCVQIWLYRSCIASRIQALKFTPPVKSTPSPLVGWYPFQYTATIYLFLKHTLLRVGLAIIFWADSL